MRTLEAMQFDGCLDGADAMIAWLKDWGFGAEVYGLPVRVIASEAGRPTNELATMRHGDWAIINERGKRITSVTSDGMINLLIGRINELEQRLSDLDDPCRRTSE